MESNMVKEKYNHWLPPLLGAAAVTLGNTIYYAESPKKVSMKLKRHEFTHVAQFEKLGYLGFFSIYFSEYIINRLKGQSHWEAHKNISLEKEAFINQEIRKRGED